MRLRNVLLVTAILTLGCAALADPSTNTGGGILTQTSSSTDGVLPESTCRLEGN